MKNANKPTAYCILVLKWGCKNLYKIYALAKKGKEMAKRSEIHSEDRLIFIKNFEMGCHFRTKMLQVLKMTGENTALRSVLPKWGITTDVFGLAGERVCGSVRIILRIHFRTDGFLTPLKIG